LVYEKHNSKNHCQPCRPLRQGASPCPTKSTLTQSLPLRKKTIPGLPASPREGTWQRAPTAPEIRKLNPQPNGKGQALALRKSHLKKPIPNPAGRNGKGQALASLLLAPYSLPVDWR